MGKWNWWYETFKKYAKCRSIKFIS